MIRSIIQLFRDGDTVSALIILFAEIFTVFCSLPVHECAHAWAAYRLGDDTARLKGRLTLSPMAHLDLWGMLMLLIAGFGYAKPVPVNIRNFKNRKRDMALVSLAGPASNLVMAMLCFLISNAFGVKAAQVEILDVLRIFFFYVGFINVNLAVFNMIPIPPLDGSRRATVILPDKYYYTVMRYERYIMIGLMLLMFSGLLSGPLLVATRAVTNGLNRLASLPFRLFIH